MYKNKKTVDIYTKSGMMDNILHLRKRSREDHD